LRQYAPYRRAAAWLQGLVLLGLPFLRVGGESAFRFDIPSLRLHFFGTSIWMQEFFLILLALLFVLFLIGLLTVLLGRVWCGWACPQTVLSDLTGRIESPRSLLGQLSSHAWTFVVSVVVGASLIWYFVSPYEFLTRLFQNRLGTVLWGFWITHTFILYLDLAFLRRRFCGTVCPYAKMQSVLYDDRTLVIAFDNRRDKECMNCQACVRACPVGIDIRKGLGAACINCAQCIDACARQTARVGKNTLVNYFWGFPETSERLLRQNVLLIAGVSVLLLTGLVYLGHDRAPFQLFVRRDLSSAAIAQDGRPVYTYRVSLRNLRSEPVVIKLSAVGGNMGTPPILDLPPSGVREVTITLQAENALSNSAVLKATTIPGGHVISIPLRVQPPRGVKEKTWEGN